LPSLYVGNLPDNFYDLDMYKFFTSKGYQVLKAKVIKTDKRTGRELTSGFYGFLSFKTEAEAERC